MELTVTFPDGNVSTFSEWWLTEDPTPKMKLFYTAWCHLADHYADSRVVNPPLMSGYFLAYSFACRDLPDSLD